MKIFCLDENNIILFERKKILIRRLLKKKKLFQPLKMEKKGLTITFNKWFKISDWSRDYYFNMLKKNWSNAYNLSN